MADIDHSTGKGLKMVIAKYSMLQICNFVLNFRLCEIFLEIYIKFVTMF